MSEPGEKEFSACGISGKIGGLEWKLAFWDDLFVRKSPDRGIFGDIFQQYELMFIVENLAVVVGSTRGIVSPICKNQAGEEQEKGQSKNPVPALAQGTYLFRRTIFTIIPCFQGILGLHQTLS